MRKDSLRTYATLHGWVGIATGLLLFIAFYAGALTLFAPALDRWAAPPEAALVTPLDRAGSLMERVLAEVPPARRDFTLHLGPAAEIPARLTWRLSRESSELMAAALTDDGGLRVVRLESGLGRFLDDLHRTGGLPVERELGTAIMGGVSLLYALALVSGLVIVLPSLAREALALRIGPNLRLLWRDAHTLLGVASLPFHLAIALTAVGFGLHDEIYQAIDRLAWRGALHRVFVADSPFAAVPADSAPAEMLPPAELLARLAARAPHFHPTALQYRAAGTRGATVAVWGGDPRFLMRGKGMAVMSPVSGALVNTDYLPGFQQGYGPLVSAVFALHFASFGGPVVTWAYFILGLSGAVLFYSGCLLWIELRRRRERVPGMVPRQGRAARWMAVITVGVCLGTMIGVSLSILASKGLHGHVSSLAGWRTGLYQAALLSALAWAAIRGPARAGAELLWAAAAVTLAIPVLSLLAGMAPSLGLWAWADSLGVDLIALAGAVLFAALARMAARRAHHGPQDSVWSRSPSMEGP